MTAIDLFSHDVNQILVKIRSPYLKKKEGNPHKMPTPPLPMKH